jgi:hypothetical protein
MNPDRERTANLVTSIFAAILIVGVIALSMNVPQGPIAEYRGVVESAGVNARRWGAAAEYLNVRLDNGEVVLAKVIASSAPAPVGGIAHVRVYRRLITRGLSYEAHQIDAAVAHHDATLPLPRK